MKTAILGSLDDLGLARLASALARRGHEVSAIVAGVAGRDGAFDARVRVVRLERSDLHPDHWHKSSSPEIAASVRRALEELTPEVAHVKGWRGLTRELATLCARASIPVVVELDLPWASCLVGTRVRTDTNAACDVPLSMQPCLRCASLAEPRTPWVPVEAQYMMLAERRADLARELDVAASVHVDRVHGVERARAWLGLAGESWELAPSADGGEDALAEAWLAIHARAIASGPRTDRAGRADWYSERMRAFALEQWDRAARERGG